MRQTTPNILDALTVAEPAPAYDLAAAMTAAPPAPILRYDYAALGEAGEGIRQHAIAIKVAERRMSEQTIEAGLHLMAVKETIPHGQWLPWLASEFSMSEDAAQRMMQIARRFGEKTTPVRLISSTVLGLLAPPSVPDSAVSEAIAFAEEQGRGPSKTEVKAIIAQHRPARCRKCGRTLTDPDAIRAGIGPCCAARLVRDAAQGEATADAAQDRPLPAWATDGDGETVAVPPDFAPVAAIAKTPLAPTVAPPRGDSAVAAVTDADGRETALAALAVRLAALVDEVRELGEVYGGLTGDFTTPLTVRHGIEKMQVVVQSNKANGGWD